MCLLYISGKPSILTREVLDLKMFPLFKGLLLRNFNKLSYYNEETLVCIIYPYYDDLFQVPYQPSLCRPPCCSNPRNTNSYYKIYTTDYAQYVSKVRGICLRRVALTGMVLGSLGQ